MVVSCLLAFFFNDVASPSPKPSPPCLHHASHTGQCGLGSSASSRSHCCHSGARNTCSRCNKFFVNELDASRKQLIFLLFVDFKKAYVSIC
jgi:hypothetical protein